MNVFSYVVSLVMRIFKISYNNFFLSFGLMIICILISCQKDPANLPNYLIGDAELIGIGISSVSTEREELAANELIDYLAKITGVEFPLLIIGDSIIPNGIIAIGNLAIESGLIKVWELDSVANDGFIMRINDSNGAICGSRDLGTVYGVYELLRRLGVKFFSEECEILSSSSMLVIPAMEKFIKPHFDLRYIFKMDVYYPDFNSYLKFGFTPNDDVGYHGDLGVPGERNWVHSASYMMPYSKYGEDHPEYFALKKDGQRYSGIGAPGHLCLSNLEMREVGVKRLLGLVEHQNDRSFFVVSQGDGGINNWCQCVNCTAYDAIKGDHMTDRLMDYVNFNARKVSESYPDKKILTLAYTSATARPPVRVDPEPNVMIMYAPLHRPEPYYDGECHSHDLNCENNLWAKNDIENWLSLYPDNMYIFDYPRNYFRWYQPFGSFYAMTNKMEYYADIGIRGLVFCVVPGNFRDLFIYVTSQLLWEPKLNVDDLINEFLPSYYGAASGSVRKYFDFLYNEIDVKSIHQHSEKSNPELVTPTFVNSSLEFFNQAEESVYDDSIFLSRVEFEKFSVLWSDIDNRNTIENNLACSLDEYAARFGEMVRIAKKHKIINIGGRIGFKEWIHQVSPIRLQNELWYNDPAIDILISQPMNLFSY